MLNILLCAQYSVICFCLLQILLVDSACPAIKHELLKVRSTKRYKAMLQRAEPLFPLLTARLGHSVKSLIDINFVYDDILIQVSHNISFIFL